MSELIASVTEKDSVLFLDLVAEVEGSVATGRTRLDAFDKVDSSNTLISDRQIFSCSIRAIEPIVRHSSIGSRRSEG